MNTKICVSEGIAPSFQSKFCYVMVNSGTERDINQGKCNGERTVHIMYKMFASLWDVNTKK